MLNSNLPTYPPLVVDECSDPGLGETIDFVHLFQSNSIPDLPWGKLRIESLNSYIRVAGQYQHVTVEKWYTICSQGAQIPERSSFIYMYSSFA